MPLAKLAPNHGAAAEVVVVAEEVGDEALQGLASGVEVEEVIPEEAISIQMTGASFATNEDITPMTVQNLAEDEGAAVEKGLLSVLVLYYFCYL